MYDEEASVHGNFVERSRVKRSSESNNVIHLHVIKLINCSVLIYSMSAVVYTVTQTKILYSSYVAVR